jgi:hypothetical protein
MKKLSILSLFVLVAFASCKKDTTNTTTTTPPAAGPQLKFVFKFDSTQVRLNGFGQVATLPANHRAQCPKFNGMSAHYIEMTQNNFTAVGHGTVLYTTPTIVSTPFTVTSGSATATYTDAIEFNKETIVGDGAQFFSIPLSQVTAGTYPYLRISVAYQNYDIKYGVLQGTYTTTVGAYTVPSNYLGTGTIASFIGYNTYITSYNIKTQTDVVNGAKQQGYWSFESAPVVFGATTYTVPYSKGQAPQGATTVVNPLFSTSAVPPGSCLVTGQFVNQAGATTPLVITGHETSDITITVSMSTNNSFEWIHNSSNPDNGYIYTLNQDTVVDMGLRGMKPILPQ